MTTEIDLALKCGIQYRSTPPGTTEMWCYDRQLQDFAQRLTAQLQAEVERLTAKFEETNQQLSAMHAWKERLRHERDHLQAEVEQSHARLAQRGMLLNDAVARIANLESWQEGIRAEIGEEPVGIMYDRGDHFKQFAEHLAAKLVDAYYALHRIVEEGGYTAPEGMKRIARAALAAKPTGDKRCSCDYPESICPVHYSHAQTSEKQCQHDLCAPNPTLRLVDSPAAETVIECTECGVSWTNPVRVIPDQTSGEQS